MQYSRGIHGIRPASPLKPSYFAPYPRHWVVKPEYSDSMAGYYTGIDDEVEPFTKPRDRAYAMHEYLRSYIHHTRYPRKDKIPWTTKCVGDYPFKGLDRDFQQPTFRCHGITDLKDPNYPHVKAIMINNMIATDSTFLFGEIIPILRIMLTQLRKGALNNHKVLPVLLFSLMGFKARIIEAYAQNGTLVLRASEMYDFTHANDAGFEEFCRWYLGDAIGNTL